MTSSLLTVSVGKVSKYVYLLTLLALIVDIGGSFGIKYVFSGVMLLWSLFLLAKCGVQKSLVVEAGLFSFFLFSAWYALVQGVAPRELYGQLSFVVYFFILVVLLKVPRGDAVALFQNVIVFGSVLVIGTFLSILIVPASAAGWNYIGETYQLGYIGTREFAGVTFPNVYYRWSMWLIPGFILSLGRSRVAVIIIGLAVVLTLSTSIIVFSILGALLLNVLIRSGRSYNLKMASTLFVVILVSMVIADYTNGVLGILFDQVSSKFSATSESSSVKLGHIEGVLTALHESILVMLLGTGAGSEFYSPGIHAYTINMEASHFNFVRQFGVIGGVVFFGYVIYVIGMSYCSNGLGRRWAIALLMLFISAGTNPLLMSPVFIVVLMLVRADVSKSREVNSGAI